MFTNSRSSLFKSNFFTIIYFLAFYGMLHSSIILPAQNLIIVMDNLPNRRTYSNNLNNIFLDDNTGESLRTGVSLKESYLNKDLLVATESVENSDLNNIIYNADLSSGYIGYNDISFDNPEDNVFHFTIGKLPNKTDQVLLKYDLFGASSSSCLARSINSRAATGGNIAKISDSWTSVSEEICSDWLKSGDNTIVFTINQQAAFNCQVKNMRLEVRRGMQENRIVITDNSLITSDGKLYVKGYIQDANENSSLVIDGIKLEILEGEFEDYIPIDVNAKKISLNAQLYESDKIKEVQTLKIKNKLIADFNTPIVKSLSTFSGQAKPENNFHLDFEKSFINIPPNALTEETEITVSKLRRIDLAPLNPGIINVTKGGTGYRFTPDGIQFKDAVTLSLEYDSTLIPRGRTANDIQTFYFNTDTKRWETVTIDSIDIVNRRIISSTTHFTDYINGIIQVPEGPQSNAFVPTMMNDIKAADPAANITLINPPVASQTGEASLSYPIKIPSGRKGMQPNLVLQYNSEGGSGWLGQGWSINLPAISLDTRWGVPTFGIDKDGNGQIQGVDEEVETEIYQLEGSQLMYPQYENSLGEKLDWMPNRHQVDKNGIITTKSMPKLSPDKAFFSLRKQGNFLKIQRLGNSPKEYYWKVTLTDGTINWYGASKPEDLLPGNPNRGVITDEQGRIVHWALVKTEDLYGNSVSYSYETISNFSSEGLNNGKAFYIRLISYTGHNGNSGQYTIIFKRQTNIRSDVNITTRLGLKQVDPYLLEAINIQFQGVTFRSYNFDYTSIRFNKTLLKSITEGDNVENRFTHTIDYYDDIKLGDQDVYFSAEEEVDICFDKCYSADVTIPALSSTPYYHYWIDTTKQILLDYCSDKTHSKIEYIELNGNRITPPVDNLFITHYPNPSCPTYPIINTLPPDPITENSAFESDLNSFLMNSLSSLQPYEMSITNKSGVYLSDRQIGNVNAFNVSFNSSINSEISYKMNYPLYPNESFEGRFNKEIKYEMHSLEVTLKIKTSENTSGDIFGPYNDFFNPQTLSLFQQALNTTYGGYPEPYIVTLVGNQVQIVIPATHLIFESITVIAGTGSIEYPFDPCSQQGNTGSRILLTSSDKNEPLKGDIDKYIHPLSCKQMAPIISEVNYQVKSNKNIEERELCNPFLENLEFILPLNGDIWDRNASVLGSTTSWSGSASLYLGIGIGLKKKTKKTTVGVQGTLGGSLSHAFLTMADIDGDGLDDIVIRKDFDLFYKKHTTRTTYDENNQPVIHHEFTSQSFPIKGDLKNFYYEKGYSWGINGQLTYGAGPISGFAGMDLGKSHSYTENNTFFTDANGDGLIDVSKNGTVFFNRIKDGNPFFEAKSDNTENLIIIGESRDVNPPPNPITNSVTLPGCDVVKVWEAPADGNIKISNRITTSDPNKETFVTIEYKKLKGSCYNAMIEIPITCEYIYTSKGYIANEWNTMVSNCPFPLGTVKITSVQLGSTPILPVNDNLYLSQYLNGQWHNFCPTTLTTTPYSIENPGFVQDMISFLEGNNVYSLFDITCINDSYVVLDQNAHTDVFNSMEITYKCTTPFYGKTFAEVYDMLYQVAHTWDESIDILSTEFVVISPSVIVNINTSIGPFSFGPYDLSNAYELELLENDIEQTIEGTDATLILDSNYVLSIILNNDLLEFNSINLQGGENISFTDCSNLTEIHKIPNNLILDEDMFRKKILWNNKIMVANGSEMDDPIKVPKELMRFSDTSPSNFNTLFLDSSNIVNQYKERIQNRRLKRMIEAKKEIEDYYEHIRDSINSKYPTNIITYSNSSTSLLFGAKIDDSNPLIENEIITFSSNCVPSNIPLFVRKGDHIYFRVHSFQNENPQVYWDPHIEYTDLTLNTLQDQNEKTIYNNSYSDGFILSSNEEVIFPSNEGSSGGTAEISWNAFSINNLTDDVTFEVIKKTVSTDDDGNETPQFESVYQQTVNAGNSAQLTSGNINIPVNGNNTSSYPTVVTSFVFKVTSTSNVDWDQLVWNPTLLFKTKIKVIENGSQDELDVVETHFPIVDYSIYKSVKKSVPYILYNLSVVQGNNKTIRLNPQLASLITINDHRDVHLVIKANNSLVGKRSITFDGGLDIDTDPLVIGDNYTQLELGFYVDDQEIDESESLLVKFIDATFPLLFVSSDVVTDQPISTTDINMFHKPQQILGPMYRQWGQFMYNPDAVGTAGTQLGCNLPGYLIDETVANDEVGQQVENLMNGIDEEQLDGIDLTTPGGLTALETQLNQLQAVTNLAGTIPFIIASASKSCIDNTCEEKWIGLHEMCNSTASGAQAAEFTDVITAKIEPDDEIIQGVVNTGAYSLSRHYEGKAKNLSAGLNVSLPGNPNINCGINGSKSIDIESYSYTDYLDINGDRYPDLISVDNLQPTNKTGGLFMPKSPIVPGNLSETGGENWGAGASGSYYSGGKVAPGTGGTQQPPSTAGSRQPFISKPKLETTDGSSSIGINGEFGYSKNPSTRQWADINGDGLNDLIELINDELSVSLSIGNSYADQKFNWGKHNIHEQTSWNIGLGSGVSLNGGSWAGGISGNVSTSSTKNSMIDVNSDGLLDLVTSDGDIMTVNINDGNSFGATITNFAPVSLRNNSSTVSESLNQTGTVAWVTMVMMVIPLKFPCISGTLREGHATNKALKTFNDFNGDGYLDILERKDGNTFSVRYSTIRRTNKIKSISNPLGGRFTIDYRVAEKNYDSPNSKWNMYSVIIETCDKIPDNGPDRQIRTFEYIKGRYDRREREFYGYETVKTHDHNIKEDGAIAEVYRTQENTYYNRNYYLKGLIKESKIYKQNDPNNWLTKETNSYILKPMTIGYTEIDINANNLNESFDVGGSEGRHTACVLHSGSQIFVSDGTNQIFSKEEFYYDGKGRVIRYNKFKDNSTTETDYTTEVQYHSIQALIDKNIITIPKQITVIGQHGNLLRERSIPSDGISPNGDITKISALIDDVNHAVTEMEYDPLYGNLKKITLPPNEKGQRMFYQYNYDSYKKNIVSITDAFGYSSAFNYDNRFDVVISQTDITGITTNYGYDTFGRLTTITGPNEQLSGAPYTILFQYCPTIDNFAKLFGVDRVDERFMPVSVTHHFDPQHPSPNDLTGDILTYTFSDGFGKPVQVKKDVVINTNTNRLGNPSYVEGLSVSGLSVYDFVGRVVNQHQQVFEIENGVENAYPNPNKSTYYKTTDYDFIDRVVKIKDEGDGVTDYTHNIEFGLLKLHTESDQDGTVRVISEIYKDLSDHVIKSVSIGNNNEKLITNFLYNEIGELKSYTDPGLLTSSYTYDQLGRKKTFNHPDNGLTTYKYDRAGNLISLQTANLATTGKWIKYIYDYNRLTKEEYPDNGTPNISNTTYIYGSVGSGTKTGRLIEQTDATGKQYFDYGLMGEMIYNERIVITPTLKPMTFITKFSYDSWNRINKITYPGNEEVSYSYDKGGNLYSIKGKIGSSDVFYIYRMDYNNFEQKTFAQYGVLGSQTVGSTIELYDYEPKLHRLSKIQVAKQKASGHDFFINPEFTYDKIGNVKSITNTQPPIPLSGTYICGQYSHAYSYDSYNRLRSAQGQLNKSSGISGILKAEYNLDLVDYYPSGEIWHKNQSYSTNSPTQGNNNNNYKNTYALKSNSHQISTITNIENNNIERFVYDKNGNLVTRSGGHNEQTLTWDEQNRLSQHQVDRNLFQHFYDATGERIVKVIGNVTKTFINHDLQNSDLLINGTITYPSGYIVTELNQTYTKHYYNGSQRIASRTGDGTSAQFEKTTDDLNGLEARQKASILQNAKAAGINEVRYEPFDPASMDELDDSLRAAGVVSIYYYHSDQLGTNTLITDMSGNPSQFFLNLPFGETMAEKIITSQAYSSPYKFNGKELDEGTGMYYYGARYYDPRISVWVSVDPLTEKFPSISSYTYTFNNPIKYIDPDGRIPWPISKTGSGVGWNTTYGWFGEQRPTHIHQGVDINKNTGRDTDFGLPVFATHDGKVVAIKLYNEHKGGGGTMVTIQSPDGSFQSVYMHLNSVDVSLNDIIDEGQQIGTIGKSGNGLSTRWRAHLHYELRKLNENGEYVSINPETSRGVLIDPQKWISMGENSGGTRPGLNINTGPAYLSAAREKGIFEKFTNAIKNIFRPSDRGQEADFWQRYENEKQNRKEQ